MAKNDWGSVLIPMIRQVMPDILANDILGVQPMTSAAGKMFNIKSQYNYRKSFVLVDQTLSGMPPLPEGYLAVDVSYEVARWIAEQPAHMWKFCDVPAYAMGMERYTISEQLYTMMALKWS